MSLGKPKSECASCGAELPSLGREGLCPRCLVRHTLASTLGPADEAAANPGSGPGFTRSLPERFGDYELLEEIARGGMGVVFRARQVSLNRVVAVKMMLSGRYANPTFIERFRREAEAAGGLQHPSIVAIHEIGEHAGQPFFSMDYVEGLTLADLVRAQPLPPVRAATYVRAIAEAVEFAHQHGVLHRDLKPSNVLIDARDQPRITDFGLAKRVESGSELRVERKDMADDGVSQLSTPDSQLTLTGQMLGSPNYMPPEQLAAERGEIGPRSDVYALGAILYHLLAGRAPFLADNIERTLLQVLDTEPLPLRLLNPSLPVDLETICLKCLAKEPRDRYASAQDFADELGRFLRQEPIHARPLGRAARLWRWSKRRPAVAALLSAVIVIAGSGTGGVLWQWRRAEQNATRETQERLRAEQNVYAADIKLAQVAVESANLGRARELLERQVPRSPGQEDQRGFEWHYLWNLAQGEERATLRGHDAIVTCVAYSPDGKLLATASFDQSVRVMDAAAHQILANLNQLGGAVCRLSMSFSPDGKMLAAAAGTNLWVWSTSDWRPIARLPAETAPLGGLTFPVLFSPDSRAIATSIGRDLKLWDAASGQLKATIAFVSDGKRNALAWSPKGKVLASCYTNRIVFWNLESQQRIGESTEPVNQPYALAFDPTGKMLAVADSSGKLKLVDVATRATVESADAHLGFVQGVAFARDGTALATCGADQLIHVWELDPLRKANTLSGHQNEVWAIAFAPDGQTLASASKDGTAKLWNISHRPTPQTTLANTVMPMWFSPDGQTLMTRSLDGSTHFWNVADGQRRDTIPSMRSDGTRYANMVSVDGSLLASGLHNGRVEIWNLERRVRETTYEVDSNPAVAVEISPDKRLLAVATGQYVRGRWQGGTKLIELATGRVEPVTSDYSGTQDQAALAFSPDGKLLAGLGPNFTIRLWDLPPKRACAILRGHTWDIVDLAFSADGSLLASASNDNTARLWNVATGRKIADLFGHKSGVVRVGFSPDGKTLVTSSNDRTVSLWSVATHREVLTLRPSGEWLHALFSPDGSTLATGGARGPVQLWRGGAR